MIFYLLEFINFIAGNKDASGTDFAKVCNVVLHDILLHKFDGTFSGSQSIYLSTIIFKESGRKG